MLSDMHGIMIYRMSVCFFLYWLVSVCIIPYNNRWIRYVFVLNSCASWPTNAIARTDNWAAQTLCFNSNFDSGVIFVIIGSREFLLLYYSWQMTMTEWNCFKCTSKFMLMFILIDFNNNIFNAYTQFLIVRMFLLLVTHNNWNEVGTTAELRELVETDVYTGHAQLLTK